jgi:hypothetical protein
MGTPFCLGFRSPPQRLPTPALLLRQIPYRAEDGRGAADHYRRSAPSTSVELLSIEMTVHRQIIQTAADRFLQNDLRSIRSREWNPLVALCHRSEHGFGHPFR